MERRKVILVSVLINAGLLAVLFIASLATEREVPSAPLEMGSHVQERPLFPESSVHAFQEQIALPPSLPKAPEVKAEEQPLVHKLPPLVPEELTPTLPQAFAPATSSSSFVEVVVKKGDTLDKISKAHHVSVDEIVKCNQLASNFLKVGQVLKMPAEKGSAAKVLPKPVAENAVAAGSEYYTVKVGDNPWTIAMKNHMKVEELLKLNGLNEERARKLKPGDRLRIK